MLHHVADRHFLHNIMLLSKFALHKICLIVREETFRFKKFGIDDRRCAMKVGTDGVILGAWVDCHSVKRAIDVGAGSGLISLILAQRGVEQIDAVEIDHMAASDAQDNAAASPWRDIIRIHHCDFENFTASDEVDLIVSNPPFFAEGEEAPDIRRACARHEGALNYSSLIDFAVKHLGREGRVAFIYPYGREDEIIYKAEMSHLKLRRICHVKQRYDRPYIRSLYEFSRIDGPIEKSELIIRQPDNHAYTPAFAALCKNLYLDL